MSDSLNKTQFFDWKYIASWVLFYVSYIWPLENITDLYVRQYVWTWRLTINITEPEIHPRSSTRNTKTLVLTLTCELVPLLLTSQATGNDTESMALHWTSLDLLINKCMYMCLALMFTTCDLNVPFSSTNPFFWGSFSIRRRTCINSSFNIFWLSETNGQYVVYPYHISRFLEYIPEIIVFEYRVTRLKLFHLFSSTRINMSL